MPTVPPGGVVLVTGANGYIAGITIQKFLDAGHRVRGSVRNASKYDWMLSHYGPNFSLVEIPDLAAPDAFTEAVKDVDGIAHVATPVIFPTDPNDIIPQAIASIMGILEAAAKEPSVKSVVYTSSQAACILQQPGQPYHLDSSKWNEESKVAWTAPVTPDLARGFLNYACAKTEAEQRSFKWVEEYQPHFTFNSVVPNVNFGTMVRPDKTGFISSGGLAKMVWDGHVQMASMFPPQWYVDVEDTGLLHLAALTQPDVQNERLFSFAGRYCYNEILAIFRKRFPDRKFADDIEEILDAGTVENARSIELLKRLKNGVGFSSLEEAISKWVLWILKAEEEGWANAKDGPETGADKVMNDFQDQKAY